MIRVFSPTDTDFTTNGEVVIKATRAVVHKADNGDFHLEIEAPIDYVNYFQPLNIIVADTPQGAQAFRLAKDIRTTRTKVKAKALHVFYDTQNYIIKDCSITGCTGEEALELMESCADSPTPFNMTSDILTSKSIDIEVATMSDSISSLVELYGGHLVRDNFNLAINSTIGQDLGVTIQYRKNLQSIERTENWDAVCTRVLPIGKDNITLNYMNGPTQYDIPFTKAVTFEQDINEEDYEDWEDYAAALVEDLEEQARAFLNQSQFPAINYTLTANVEKITDVGDLVEVKDEVLGISITAHVLSYEYDAILGKYLQIQFGTSTPELSELMKSVSATVDKSVAASTGNLKDYVIQQNAAMKTYVDGEVSDVPSTVIDMISSYLYFVANETFSLSSVVCAGWINSTREQIKFSVPLQKTAAGRTASLTALKINGFGNNGAIWTYSSSGKDVIADSNITVDCVARADALTITLTNSAGFSPDASTPVTIEIESMTAKFT